LLTFFHRLARPLHDFRIVLWLLLLGAAVLFGVTVLGFVDGEDAPLASFLACLWAGFLIAFSNVFASPPPQLSSGAGWIASFKTRCKRGLLWLIAVSTIVLFVFVAFLSMRAIGLWFR
jgi:hypothetical protein